MTCEHTWMVFSTAMMPPTILVQCADCGEYGGVLDHTKEEWGLAFYAPTTPFRWADDSRVILHADLPRPSPDDLRLVQDFLQHADDGGDDDQIDALGTMSWTVIEDGVFNDDAAAEFRAHIFGQVDQEPPTTCPHQWLITNVIGEGADGAEIELRCSQCHRRATVLVTDDECKTIISAWTIGIVLEWGDVLRVQLPEDLRPPAVADLVDGLNLFEGDDDDDIPF